MPGKGHVRSIPAESWNDIHLSDTYVSDSNQKKISRLVTPHSTYKVTASPDIPHEKTEEIAKQLLIIEPLYSLESFESLLRVSEIQLPNEKTWLGVQYEVPNKEEDIFDVSSEFGESLFEIIYQKKKYLKGEIAAHTAFLAGQPKASQLHPNSRKYQQVIEKQQKLFNAKQHLIAIKSAISAFRDYFPSIEKTSNHLITSEETINPDSLMDQLIQKFTLLNKDDKVAKIIIRIFEHQNLNQEDISDLISFLHELETKRNLNIFSDEDLRIVNPINRAIYNYYWDKYHFLVNDVDKRNRLHEVLEKLEKDESIVQLSRQERALLSEFQGFALNIPILMIRMKGNKVRKKISDQINKLSQEHRIFIPSNEKSGTTGRFIKEEKNPNEVSLTLEEKVLLSFPNFNSSIKELCKLFSPGNQEFVLKLYNFDCSREEFRTNLAQQKSAAYLELQKMINVYKRQGVATPVALEKLKNNETLFVELDALMDREEPNFLPILSLVSKIFSLEITEFSISTDDLSRLHYLNEIFNRQRVTSGLTDIQNWLQMMITPYLQKVKSHGSERDREAQR